MSAGPPISIVIPTLNAGRAFGTVLHRIMGQARVPLEVLVVDSGSQDATRHIVSQFPTARFVEGPTRPGPRAWNQACEAARGELVAFLAQDAVPADAEWLARLSAPFDDPSVAAAYGSQRMKPDLDPPEAFRLARRFPPEGHQRRARFADPLRYETITFSLANAALRRTFWRGIHFNEHLPVGAEREWARQVLLASCTIAYTPEAIVERTAPGTGLRDCFHEAILTGWTDEYLASAAGSLRLDAPRSVRSAAWHVFCHWRWDQLPRLAVEDAAHRYGYRLGRRMHRLAPSVRSRIAPEIASETPRRELDDWELAV